jgi:inhibitor of cysteine peptidase
MVKRIVISGGLAFMLFLATACSQAKSVTLTAAEKGSQIFVKVGDQIVISLDGNPSTGYTWEAQDLDPTIFEQIGEVTFTSTNPGLVGSGGTLTITFKALKPGTAPLTLAYHRPWETGTNPIETFTITVTVK